MASLAQMRLEFTERTLGWIDGVARRRGRDANLPSHLSAGLAGEDAAFFYLRRKGYTVVARRWSSGELPGDIDLGAWQDSLLCFVEVKTRTARDATPAQSAVDAHKRHTLRRLARRYLRQLPQPQPPQVRFDVLGVYLIPGQDPQFEHFEAAFDRAPSSRDD